MTLQLDERQQAMLAEMGLRTWAPLTAPEPEPAFVARATQPSRVPPPQPVVHDAPGPQEAVANGAKGQVAQRVAGPGAVTQGVDTMDWSRLGATVAACQACALCEGRRQAVFGMGDAQADWLIVGEPPGEQEDQEAEPFAGPPGQLLDNMLKALDLARSRNVFITNVLKCRAPGNRNPTLEELAQCEPFLQRQIALLQPKVILAMGRFAVQILLQSNEPIGRLRGRAHAYGGVPVVVTYHPASLVRNPADKGKAWADLCLAMALVRGDGAH